MFKPYFAPAGQVVSQKRVDRHRLSDPLLVQAERSERNKAVRGVNSVEERFVWQTRSSHVGNKESHQISGSARHSPSACHLLRNTCPPIHIVEPGSSDDRASLFCEALVSCQSAHSSKPPLSNFCSFQPHVLMPCSPSLDILAGRRKKQSSGKAQQRL